VFDSSLSVSAVMTTDLVTVNINDKLSVAQDVMRLGRIRHLLVLDDDGKLVGVISQRDLFHSGLLRALGYGTRAKEQVLDALVVKEAMHTELTMTTPNTPLREAARIMSDKQIGCLPVLEQGKLVGILTEGDFTLLVAGKKIAG
jgi:CBS domain-containing membrane protein